MKIGITPSIKETYKNQFEYCIDIRLINFLKYCFINPKIFIIYESSLNIKNINLLIISGGNDIYDLVKSKKNFIRNNNDNISLKEECFLQLKVFNFKQLTSGEHKIVYQCQSPNTQK